MLQSLCGVDFNKTLAGQLTKKYPFSGQPSCWVEDPQRGSSLLFLKWVSNRKLPLNQSPCRLCLVLSLCDDDGTALLHIANGMKRNVLTQIVLLVLILNSYVLLCYASSIITYIAISVLFTNSSNFQANGLNTALLAKIFNAKTLQYTYMLQNINHKIFKGY